MIKGKNILLGITGSIAAYKSAELVRLFKKSGALVKVVQTKSSVEFITPLTLSTLSENPVHIDMVDDNQWNSHIKLALWADIFIIAPLTANTLSKLVTGNCDNLLLAIYLSYTSHVYFAPAMDLEMYRHPTTLNNISKLERYGHKLIPSRFGELASGLIGEGRMAEPLEIFEIICNDISEKILKNKKVLVTAGPTHELIDEVRYISNYSSGKMGIALANEFANQGAKVDLVIGPSNEKCFHSNITVHNIISAQQMFDNVNKIFPKTDISIFSAAVADYAPINKSKGKIKKNKESLSLPLVRTKDILLEMSKLKTEKQFIAGFALESENEIKNAKLKLKNKSLDMIVMNSLNDPRATFGHDTNKVTVISRKGEDVNSFGLKAKDKVSKDIVNLIIRDLS